VILSFNHPDNVKPLCRAFGCGQEPASQELRGMSELVVIEDGGGDARELWRAAAAASQGRTRVIETDNLHEIRAYNTGFNASSSRILVMLQDDDLPPPPSKWLHPGTQLFKLHPRLALISCTDGFTTPEIFQDHYGRALPILTEDSRLPGTPFMFVVGANSGPVLYRAAAFQQVGGFNLSYSGPGEPGIGFETEISLRLWLRGWQSAIMDCGEFQRGIGGHGTLSSEGKRQLRKRIWALNQEHMRNTFSMEVRQGIASQVRKLNAEAPLRFRSRRHICHDLSERMKRRPASTGKEKVSRKGAKIVQPWYKRYQCGSGSPEVDGPMR